MRQRANGKWKALANQIRSGINSDYHPARVGEREAASRVGLDEQLIAREGDRVQLTCSHIRPPIALDRGTTLHVSSPFVRERVICSFLCSMWCKASAGSLSLVMRPVRCRPELP